ncbi:high affinity cGMP-specific 3',5'-cyclic phosphodiesterase 9A-like isoform X1 [Pomacea canaliculata]|uniref:high affinity cGMP-specific 3',5'-cyclic phosphodiesterase 9A-like isoform X1 n=2 Tax=Pomacea canaliculata TaxID=400727 RepID=UPI000D737DEA|nr:high affinity cGMP-specific 3',5'-cyclic phosphodiesterase 9A-like isoform X1 [Pomacea canaliculata]
MATKVVYFLIDGREEQAEFRSDDESEDVRETFRAAAEAGPSDILKLYNTRGNLVNISHALQCNTPDSRYTLEVVAMNYNASSLASIAEGIARKDGSLAAKIGLDLETIEARLEEVEKKVYVDNGEMPHTIVDLKKKVEHFKEKLEGVEHLSWLGLFKDMSSGTSRPFWDRRNSQEKMDSYKQRVYEKFMCMSKVQVTEEVQQELKKPTFDNWQWDDSEMLILLRQMYVDLGLVSRFNIQMPTLLRWLFKVYTKYNHVPFHNFKHCFMVSQMMYGLVWLMDLPSKLDPLEILILLTSAICHDLDHPGYNNAYQINARTELALRYNDISPLENHHCAVAFEILESKECNIFAHLPREQFRHIREGMIRCILATDMAKHNEILNTFKSLLPHFDFTDKEHRAVLMMILIKVADISNECRPMEVSEPWLECLLQEFFNQSDMEKLEGLPVAPFMDRDKVTKPSSQIGFIKFVLLPLFEAVGELFPQIDGEVIDPVRRALEYYTDMQKALEEGKKKEKEKDTGPKQNGITSK